MKRRIIGIDVGKNGGIVVYDTENNRLLECIKMPPTPKDLLDFLSIYKENSVCYLERVNGMTGQSASASFVFGEGVLEKREDQKILLRAEILEKLENGNRKVKFEYDGIFNEILDQIGLMPLPPYIHEKLKEKDRYQTVYAKYEGSAAAPTAGLHFTNELLEKLQAKGIEIANVTLHVGIGTFRPVKVENVEEHDMHSEHFYIKTEDAEKINKAKREGHRVIAVGTTSCRVLESIADENGMVKTTESDTRIFIYPGYKFKCIDALITNFHLPESTLIMLVSALAGKEFIMKAYNEAVEKKYRFFSFGDAMFIK